MRPRSLPWFAVCLLIVLGAAPAASAAERVRLERLSASKVLSAGEVPRERVGPPPRVIELRVPDPERLENEKARAARERAHQTPALPGTSAAPSEEEGPAPSAAVFDELNEIGLVAGNSTPPDSTGAIGPSHYVEMVNREVGVFGRADLGLIATTGQGGLDDFVGSPGNNAFDPQIQWDPQANRWLYVTDLIAGSDNFLAFGWSKTADPTPLGSGGSSGNWCRFFIDTGDELDDYPKLGHNDNHIIIGTNVFDGDAFVTSRIWAVSKPANGVTSCAAPAVSFTGEAGSPLETTDGDPVFTPVPANTFESSANGYVVAADSPFDVADPSQVTAWHVSGPSNAPSLTEDGNMNVSGFDFPANVPQPSTSRVLDSLDARLTQAVARTDPATGGQAVWTQHTVDGPGGRSVVRWYELLPASTTVRQEGTISDPSHFVFNGAISPTSDGASAAVDYNVGSSSLLAQIRARSRRGSTSLDQMVDEITLGESVERARDFTCNPGPCRWGDYAGASPDPANGDLVWGSNQVNGQSSGTNPHWVTRNFALTVERSSPEPTPEPTPSPEPPSPAPTPPPDSTPPAEGTATDTDAPDAELSAKQKQKAGKPIKVKVSCDEDCTAVATGKVVVRVGADRSAPARAAGRRKARFKLKKATEEIAAGETATLKLRPKGRKAKRKLKRLVKRGAKAKAKIKAEFADRAGNSTTERLTIRLRR